MPMSYSSATSAEATHRVTINRIHYNPPGGDDPKKINEEYVILENKGEKESR